MLQWLSVCRVLNILSQLTADYICFGSMYLQRATVQFCWGGGAGVDSVRHWVSK